MKKNSEKYLFGFITHDSNVKDIVHIVEPYMIIEAEDDVQAKVNYCTIHDIASHNTAELIAKKSGSVWWKITKYLSHEQTASIIEKLERNSSI